MSSREAPDVKYTTTTLIMFPIVLNNYINPSIGLLSLIFMGIGQIETRMIFQFRFTTVRLHNIDKEVSCIVLQNNKILHSPELSEHTRVHIHLNKYIRRC